MSSVNFLLGCDVDADLISSPYPLIAHARLPRRSALRLDALTGTSGIAAGRRRRERDFRHLTTPYYERHITNASLRVEHERGSLRTVAVQTKRLVGPADGDFRHLTTSRDRRRVGAADDRDQWKVWTLERTAGAAGRRWQGSW